MDAHALLEARQELVRLGRDSARMADANAACEARWAAAGADAPYAQIVDQVKKLIDASFRAQRTTGSSFGAGAAAARRLGRRPLRWAPPAAERDDGDAVPAAAAASAELSARIDQHGESLARLERAVAGIDATLKQVVLLSSAPRAPARAGVLPALK